MKASGVLPDTCIWIEYFKPGASALKQTLERLLLNESVFVCGPILYELVQGLKSDKEKTNIVDAMKSLEYIEMSESLWIKAGEISSTLHKSGKTLPLSDILIAALVIKNNLSIFTTDKHFEEIKDVLLYPIAGIQ
ncbi:MAG: PIN domain-containing protein [Candidatus Brocadia sp.]|nr:PIN domain-containing protein [Candidatus Brocadia sp.]